MKNDTDVDRIFHALSDATRRDIMSRAIQREQSVSDLSRRYAMSFAAVQKHVAVLERAELIAKERRGKQQIVHSELATVRRAVRLLQRYEQLWRGRADRIDSILADDENND